LPEDSTNECPNLGEAYTLTSQQKQDMKFFTAAGMVVEEKNPAVGAGLGLLPGFGSFYVREYGAGIVNLLFWPASILWDPVSGYEGAQAINYYATREQVKRKMNREMRVLDDGLTSGKLSRDDYILQKRKIEQKYLPEA
jgi:hypothetical protein